MDIKEIQIGSTQVLEVLPYFNEEEVKKISTKFMNFLKDNEREEYKISIDSTKPLEELGLDESTYIILGIIYRAFWANLEQRENFDRILKENDRKHEEELGEKFNPDDVFKNVKRNTQDSEIHELVVVKEKWYQKIFNKIKNFFKKNKTIDWKKGGFIANNYWNSYKRCYANKRRRTRITYTKYEK